MRYMYVGNNYKICKRRIFVTFIKNTLSPQFQPHLRLKRKSIFCGSSAHCVPKPKQKVTLKKLDGFNEIQSVSSRMII